MKGGENMGELPTRPEESNITFDQLTAEFDAYKKALPEEQQGDSNLWRKFLLNSQDDGSWVFARSMDDTLHGARQEVVKLVEEGKIQEATALGDLTKQMGERYSGMFKSVEVPTGGVKFERVKSPVTPAQPKV